MVFLLQERLQFRTMVKCLLIFIPQLLNIALNFLVFMVLHQQVVIARL